MMCQPRLTYVREAFTSPTDDGIVHAAKEAQMSQRLDMIDAMITMYGRQSEQSTDEAFRSIESARRELDRIEENLQLAQQNEPFLRIGEIRGVDAGAVFSAFGALENLAVAKKLREKNDAGDLNEPSIAQTTRPIESLTISKDEHGDTVLTDENGEEWGIMPGESVEDAIARIGFERLHPID